MSKVSTAQADPPAKGNVRSAWECSHPDLLCPSGHLAIYDPDDGEPARMGYATRIYDGSLLLIVRPGRYRIKTVLSRTSEGSCPVEVWLTHEDFAGVDGLQDYEKRLKVEAGRIVIADTQWLSADVNQALNRGEMDRVPPGAGMVITGWSLGMSRILRDSGPGPVAALGIAVS